jgi:hypothetical protein
LLFKTSNFDRAGHNSSPTPNHSISQAVQHQPATRPERFPESILWSLKDAQNAQLALESNKSRPSMEKCIRNEDGSAINLDQWRSIKQTARTIAQTDLLSLPVSKKAKTIPRTKVYYKQNHIKAWWDAIHQLEERQPLLRLCAANWKADHVLGATLLARASEARQKLKKQLTISDEEERRDGNRKKYRTVGISRDGAAGPRQKQKHRKVISFYSVIDKTDKFQHQDVNHASDVETSSDEEAGPSQRYHKVSDKPRKKRNYKVLISFLFYDATLDSVDMYSPQDANCVSDVETSSDEEARPRQKREVSHEPGNRRRSRRLAHIDMDKADIFSPHWHDVNHASDVGKSSDEEAGPSQRYHKVSDNPRKRKRNYKVLITFSFYDAMDNADIYPRMPAVFPTSKRLQMKKRDPDKNTTKHLKNHETKGDRVGWLVST